MSIGIYGGSFNPIHKGHTRLAQALCRRGIVEEVWFMVSPLNPLKQDQQADFLDYDLRLRMAQLATARSRSLRVSDFEAHLPIPSYTVHTLAALREAYPDKEFCLVIGSDNWERFGRWYQAETIRSNYDIVVYGRGEDHSGVTVHRKDGTVEHHPDFPLYNISSTELRQALRTGNIGFARQWLNASVLRKLLRFEN